MRYKIWMPTLLFVSLVIAGCATGGGETAPVEDKSVGTDTSGAPDRAGPEGGALAGSERADLLSVRRIYFAFDSSSIDEESRAVVEAHAAYLADNPGIKVHLEGHADERGTREYNLALGERRAQSVERMLRVLGIAADRITTVSYGEEKPVAPEHNESAWRLNRRVEIVYSFVEQDADKRR